MKVYILGPREDQLNSTYDSLLKILKREGHKTDIKWREVSRNDDVKNYQETYKRNVKSIKECDFMIVEASNPVGSVGFLIATALEYKKPVLALYNLDYARDISTTLKAKANESRILFYREYTKDTIDKVVMSCLKDMKQHLDTKFILIISPEIDKYLEWASDYKRMHKAQLVREAVEAYMENDKDWAEFQAEDDGMVK